ncbi:spore germination protein [Alkalibaculum sp. M08DMB]|uniref:Spore germination protein n=1 Tax=Alkalibaculum sporogenes TaxID=2655001 RepID=A0A6A7K5L0_9FIRM|nr:spore germination protein [Alkalibaculum sporogenes]MPW24557.1 spore germination protein [Alkalibaculum sporogenes]
MKLVYDIEKNIATVKEIIGIDRSFDIAGREFLIGDKKAYLVFVDGFAKDDTMLHIMKALQKIDKKDLKKDTISRLLNKEISYIEVDTFDDISKMELSVLSGAIALILDGEKQGIIIDARTYPVRSPQEPDTEKVTRGARDSFVETIVFNTALIRRRVRDPKLYFEIQNVGKRSKTDVVIGYIDDLIDHGLLEKIRKQIEDVNVDALVMAEKTLVELMVKSRWYNPLPQVKFTERPDVVAAHLMEGHFAIIVDTSPSVMLLPVSIFHFTQHAEDYYQNIVVGTYLRWVRFLGMFASLYTIPLWLLLVYNRNLLPEFLQFIGPNETGEIPIFLQFLILELGLGILKIASIHTPNALSTSLGIIGGLLIGDLAIKVGWFSPETILYTVVSVVGTFANPSVEFGMAITIFRILLLVLTGLFSIPGFIIGNMFILYIICTTSSFDHKKYTWPLYPFDWSALKSVLIRKPIPQLGNQEKRKNKT